MSSDLGDSDWDDDDGLPDAAFTEGELEAGVQHIMRSGRADACLSPVTRQLQPNDAQLDGNVLHFATFEQVQVWAKANPGSAFTRAADGRGFEAKTKTISTATPAEQVPTAIRSKPSDSQQEIDERIRSAQELCVLSPHMHDILTNSASNYRTCHIIPFSHATFNAELERIGHEGRARLRKLLYDDLKFSKEFMLRLENDFSRNRRMKSGHYGQELRRRLIELRERVLVILDEFNSKSARGDRS